MNTNNIQKPVLKMTRSVRRQLYTADIIFAMSCCLKGELPKKTKAVLDRVQTRVDNINKILYGGGRFVLSPRDYKKYNRVIDQLKKIVMDIGEDNQLSPDFFNAVMLLVEDTWESVTLSKKNVLKHEWRMLRNSMATFCRHILNEPDEYDPDWPGYRYEGLGVALGNKFNKVMMS